MKKTQIALVLSAMMIAPTFAAEPVKASGGTTLTVTDDITYSVGHALKALTGSKVISQGNTITGSASVAGGASTSGGELELRDVTMNLQTKAGTKGIEVKGRNVKGEMKTGKLVADKLTLTIEGGMSNSQGIVAQDADVEISNSTITVKGEGINLKRSVASLKDITLNVKGNSAATGLSITDTILDNAENITINLVSDAEVDYNRALVNAVHVRGDAEKTSLTMKNSTITTNGGYSAVRVDKDLGFNAANTTIDAKGTGMVFMATMEEGAKATAIQLTEGTTVTADEDVYYTVMGAGELTLDNATLDSKSKNFAKGGAVVEANNKSVLKIAHQADDAGVMTVSLKDSTLEVGDKVELTALELDEKSRVEFDPNAAGAVLSTKNLVNNNGTIVLNAKMVGDELKIDRIEADNASGTTKIDLKVEEGVDLTGADLRLVDIKNKDADVKIEVTSNDEPLPFELVLDGETMVLKRRLGIDASTALVLPSSLFWGELDSRDARTGGSVKALDKGLWVRVKGETAKSERDDHAKTEGVTVQVGFDTELAPNWTGSAFVNVGRSTADFDVATNNVTLNRVGFGVAATRTFDNNAYVEFMANASHDRYTVEAEKAEDKVNGKHLVASVEAGHRFAVAQGYVEPQVQVAYTYAKVKDYTLGAQTVGTDAFHGVAARVSVKAGMETDAYNVWARADLLPRMGGKLTANLSEKGMNGVTLEEKTSGMGYGLSVGSAYRFNADWQLTANAAATKHHGMKPAFTAGLGVKRAF